MDYALAFYITTITLSGIMNLFLCIFVFLKREKITSSTFFIPYTASLAVYCFSYAISLTSDDLKQIIFWNTMQYLGLPISAPLGLLFILHYLGYKKLKPVYTSLLLIIPIISTTLVATNHLHYFFYKTFITHPQLGLPYVYIEINIGYIIHGTFTFSCLFVSVIILFLRWKNTSAFHRKQLFVLILGQLIPIILAFSYLIGITPTGIDPVPIVMWINSILYIWAILSKDMFTIQPIAKEMLFQSMSEGVIVLDKDFKLIEFNTAANQIFPELSNKMLGHSIHLLWVNMTQSHFPFNNFSENETTELCHLRDDQYSFYQIRISVLKDPNHGIVGYLLLMIDINLTKQLQLSLEQQAYHDDLTKIFNRAYFINKSNELLYQCKKYDLPFSIILFDIDHFKLVNDTHGHHVGDKLLLYVVEMTKNTLPEQAIFARYGGEEFIIALPNIALKEAEYIANTIRLHFEQNPLIENNMPLHITASFGVTSYKEVENLQQLIEVADQALYDVKRNGRNQVKSLHTLKTT